MPSLAFEDNDEAPWAKVVELLVINRLCDPRSELFIHEKWFPQTAMDLLLDWEGDVENRVYVSRYVAEDILNWRTERINGRNLLNLVVLRELAEVPKQGRSDKFAVDFVEQIRVLKLVAGRGQGVGNKRKRIFECQVEIWQLLPQERQAGQKAGGKKEWRLVETRIPLRRGKPLPLIPFVFHGPRNSLPEVCKLPLGDIVFVNLDHYRLDADYKHGMHFTALPTAWASGFDKSATLRIGPSTAWVTEITGATAGGRDDW